MNPPADHGLEAALLGAILTTDALLPGLVSVDRLTPEVFDRPVHQRVFETMVDISARGERVDGVLVAGGLGTDVPGGDSEAFVAGLYERAGSITAVSGYASRLVELAKLRRKFHAARQLLEAAANSDLESVGEAEAELAASAETSVRRRSRQERQQQIRSMADGKATVWSTPFRKLNDMLAGGLRPGQFTILAGWASHGKSVLATQFLSHLSKKGARCALYTNEMESEELDARDVARAADIPFLRLVQGQVSAEERARVDREIAQIGTRFELVEAAGMSAEEIAYDVRRERWDVAVIDLLNGLPGSTETKDIDHNMSVLAAASRQAHAHLIGCQHLNQARHVGRPYPPEPAPADIRGSGAIYNLSNNVLFIYLVESVAEPGEPSSEAVLRVAKARGGIRGKAELRFMPHRMQFVLPAPAGTVGSAVA